jgi:hypothetical protein
MAKNTSSLLQARILGVARAHFFYILFFAASIIAFDANHLVTRENIEYRWMAVVVLLVSNTLVWYLVRASDKSKSFYNALTYVLIVADILFASYILYYDRGMASRSVVLYTIPIAVAAILNSRSALFATAALCTAGYAFAATKYFYDYFNEGYKAELYSVMIFYSACFFILASVLWAIMRYQRLK